MRPARAWTGPGRGGGCTGPSPTGRSGPPRRPAYGWLQFVQVADYKCRPSIHRGFGMRADGPVLSGMALMRPLVHALSSSAEAALPDSARVVWRNCLVISQPMAYYYP